jgi:hypothetical protein
VKYIYFVRSVVKDVDDRSGIVASRLDHADALLNDNFCVADIIRRRDSGKKSNVDSEGFRGHLSTPTDSVVNM